MKDVYVLIGDPVGHSLSPQMHNSAFKALGMDADFLKMRVRKDELGASIRGMKALGISGANVTVPHKIEVIKHLDEIDPLAKRIGAVNTIVNEEGKLKGYNTDGHGILQSLKNEIDLTDKHVTIFGAGGCGRAAAHTLAMEGIISGICIINRNREKAHNLSEEINKTGKDCKELEIGDAQKAVDETDIVINCTSMGMRPQEDKSPLTGMILDKNILAMDAVYNPLKTKFIEQATTAGCRVITGENMLINQGAKCFNLWRGVKPDIELMRAVVRKELGHPLYGKNAVILGFMGAGKSSTGRALSNMLNMNFLDIDEEIERMSGMKIADIFDKYGEGQFRAIELDAINLHSIKRNVVISCGGGAVLNSINLMRLREGSELFLLKASAETMLKRLANDKERPLIQGNEEERRKRIEKLMEMRKPFYEFSGAKEIDTDNLDPAEVAKRIASLIGGDDE